MLPVLQSATPRRIPVPVQSFMPLRRRTRITLQELYTPMHGRSKSDAGLEHPPVGTAGWSPCEPREDDRQRKLELLLIITSAPRTRSRSDEREEATVMIAGTSEGRRCGGDLPRLAPSITAASSSSRGTAAKLLRRHRR